MCSLRVIVFLGLAKNILSTGVQLVETIALSSVTKSFMLGK